MPTARRLAGALLLVAIGAGIALTLVVALTGGEDETSVADPGPEPEAETTTTVVRPDPETNPNAAELFDLIDAFGDMTVHATYRVTFPSQPEREAVIEVWQKDGQARQEAETPTGRVAFLDLTDRTVLCQQPTGGSYTCGLVSESERSTFDQLSATLLGKLAEQEIEVRDEERDGLALRCFRVTVPTESELCVTDDGVLASISSEEGSVLLTDYETEVDDDVFVPPVPPGAS